MSIDALFYKRLQRPQIKTTDQRLDFLALQGTGTAFCFRASLEEVARTSQCQGQVLIFKRSLRLPKSLNNMEFKMILVCETLVSRSARYHIIFGLGNLFSVFF